jgi:ketosteroid isomerase-like protein
MKKRITFLIIPLAFTLGFFSCNQSKEKKQNVETDVNNSKLDSASYDKLEKELLAIDVEFSNYSVDHGFNEAFAAYIADDGVLLRQHHMPIVSKDSVMAIMNKDKKTNWKMSWVPVFADVAGSGELGYTYGTYNLQIKGKKGDVETSEGTYISVWKKDKNGKWKLALDSGNDGLKPVKKDKQI